MLFLSRIYRSLGSGKGVKIRSFPLHRDKVALQRKRDVPGIKSKSESPESNSEPSKVTFSERCGKRAEDSTFSYREGGKGNISSTYFLSSFI